MKKLVLKKWVEKVLGVICALSLTFIMTTIESAWTPTYLICLVVAFILFGSTAYLLNKYGRNEEE